MSDVLVGGRQKGTIHTGRRSMRALKNKFCSGITEFNGVSRKTIHPGKVEEVYCVNMSKWTYFLAHERTVHLESYVAPSDNEGGRRRPNDDAAFENHHPLRQVYRQNETRPTSRRPMSGDCILKSDADGLSEANNEILSNLKSCGNLTIISIYV